MNENNSLFKIISMYFERFDVFFFYFEKKLISWR